MLWIDAASGVEFDMDNARIQGGGNYVESIAGYTGDGVRAEISEGFDQTHPDWTNPILVRFDTNDSHGHCTAGIVGGNGSGNPAARGMMPNAQLIEASVGGVSALLQDLRASGVQVGPASRCMLLSTAMLEGWVQQQLALHVWLPLLAPRGDALLELLGPSLRLVETPTGSGFKGAWCFDWRAPETTHPILIAWMRLRGQIDPRFAPTAADAGLCPVDVGVHVLEGILLSLQHVSPPRAVSAAARPASAAPRTASAASRTATQPPSGSISGSISGAELPRSSCAASTAGALSAVIKHTLATGPSS